jgi:hypothetical protein
MRIAKGLFKINDEISGVVYAFVLVRVHLRDYCDECVWFFRTRSFLCDS